MLVAFVAVLGRKSWEFGFNIGIKLEMTRAVFSLFLCSTFITGKVKHFIAVFAETEILVLDLYVSSAVM